MTKTKTPVTQKSDPDSEVLAVEELSVGYGDNIVVTDVSFAVKPGEILAIVGESGSGKSTILRFVEQFLPPAAAVAFDQVQVCGDTYDEKNSGKPKGSALAGYRGRQIGVVFQEPGSSLNRSKKIGKQFRNVLAHHFNHSASKADEVATELLKKLQFRDPATVLDSYPFELSGGMKQRVAIALAMSLEPEVLLADEPTAALDATVQREIVELLLALRDSEGTAIVMVTHDLALAKYMADRVLVLHHGIVQEQGGAESVVENPQAEYTRRLLADARHVASAASRPASVLSEDRAGAVQELPPLIVGKQVAVGYGSTPIVKPVTFTIGQRDSLGLVGESGSGKSTLAKAMVQFATVLSGELYFQNPQNSGDSGVASGSGGSGGSGAVKKQDLVDPSAREQRSLRREIQMVIQDSNSSFLPRSTVLQYISEPRRNFYNDTPNERAELAAELLDQVGLSGDFLNRYPSQLSGGQRQRVAIARALGVKPKLLICDEITSALDKSVQRRMIDLLLQIREEQELGLVVISHDLSLVQAVCDSAMVLRAGEVVEHIPIEELPVSTNEYTQQLREAAYPL